MCSILSLLSFKSTERFGTKEFFYIWSVVLPLWLKIYVANIFSTFVFLSIKVIILLIINYMPIFFITYTRKEPFYSIRR